MLRPREAYLLLNNKYTDVSEIVERAEVSLFNKTMEQQVKGQIYLFQSP
jgi:hypothetical protein